MEYICTLKKDLPNYNKGFVFYAECSPTTKEISIKIIEDNRWVYGFDNSLINIIDNEDWIDKKIHENMLFNLSCPVCGSTKGLLFSERTHKTDCGVIYYQSSVKVECPCGNIYPLGKFTSHSELY